jgi:hypothetical protein
MRGISPFQSIALPELAFSIPINGIESAGRAWIMFNDRSREGANRSLYFNPEA